MPGAEPIPVAILGAGVGAAHVEGYRALPGRFAVRTICDRDTDRARPLAEAAGASVAADIAAALDDPGIALIDICLPPALHAEVAVAALARGKHVICEKPLAASLAEVDRIAAAAVAAGRMVFPVFQYRYGPAADRLVALIEAGCAGAPFVASLETHWNRGPDYYAVPWRGTWAGERGGALLSHAIHVHDWLSLVLGPVASVHAETATRVNRVETEDCAALAIRMESGALATSSVTLGAADDTTRLRFCFEKLTAESGSDPYAPAEGRWTFTARAPAAQAEVDRIVADVPPAQAGFAGFFDAVADALAGRAGRAVTLEDGRRSLAFVTAVYASARSGRPVALPLAADHPAYAGWGPG